ncbi:uncharacterized protein LOC144864479 [Branchiostoma floridae x Branchiostoma japonicum]
MDQAHREILRKHREDIVRDLNVDLIKNNLIQNGVFDIPQWDLIKKSGMETRSDKATALMDELPTRGPKAFWYFCESLMTGGYDFLGKSLIKEAKQISGKIPTRILSLLLSRQINSIKEQNQERIKQRGLLVMKALKKVSHFKTIGGRKRSDHRVTSLKHIKEALKSHLDQTRQQDQKDRLFDESDVSVLNDILDVVTKLQHIKDEIQQDGYVTGSLDRLIDLLSDKADFSDLYDMTLNIGLDYMQDWRKQGVDVADIKTFGSVLVLIPYVCELCERAVTVMKMRSLPDAEGASTSTVPIQRLVAQRTVERISSIREKYQKILKHRKLPLLSALKKVMQSKNFRGRTASEQTVTSLKYITDLKSVTLDESGKSALKEILDLVEKLKQVRDDLYKDGSVPDSEHMKTLKAILSEGQNISTLYDDVKNGIGRNYLNYFNLQWMTESDISKFGSVLVFIPYVCDISEQAVTKMKTQSSSSQVDGAESRTDDDVEREVMSSDPEVDATPDDKPAERGIAMVLDAVANLGKQMKKINMDTVANLGMQMTKINREMAEMKAELKIAEDIKGRLTAVFDRLKNIEDALKKRKEDMTALEERVNSLKDRVGNLLARDIDAVTIMDEIKGLDSEVVELLEKFPDVDKNIQDGLTQMNKQLLDMLKRLDQQKLDAFIATVETTLLFKDFEALAIKLGFDRDEIIDIRSKAPANIRRQKSELLGRWREREGNNATVTHLRQACRSAGLSTLADQISGNFRVPIGGHTPLSPIERGQGQSLEKQTWPSGSNGTSPIGATGGISTIGTKGGTSTIGVTGGTSTIGAERGTSIIGATGGTSIIGAERGTSIIGAKRGTSIIGAERETSIIGATGGTSIIGAKEGTNTIGAERGTTISATGGASIIGAERGTSTIGAERGTGIVGAERGTSTISGQRGTSIIDAERGTRTTGATGGTSPVVATGRTSIIDGQAMDLVKPREGLQDGQAVISVCRGNEMKNVCWIPLGEQSPRPLPIPPVLEAIPPMPPITPKADVRKYFFYIKERMTVDWKDLAFFLDFGSTEIESIHGRNRDDESRCMDMLEKWRRRRGSAATIEILVRALSEAGIQDVVDGLKMKFPEIAEVIDAEENAREEGRPQSEAASGAKPKKK